LIFGDYPKSMRSRVGSRLPEFSISEAARLKGSLDFVGINYYTTFYARHDSSSVIGVLLNDSVADSGAITLRKFIVILLFIDPWINFYELENIVSIITKLEIMSYLFQLIRFLCSAFIVLCPSFQLSKMEKQLETRYVIEAK
jgi:hypothetical protein